MLIGTMKHAHTDWHFFKFYEREHPGEATRPQYSLAGLPKTVRVKPSEIALLSAAVAIVDSFPNADDLYIWLSEHAKAQFQILIGFPADAKFPLAFGIFFRDRDDMLHFAEHKLTEL